VSIRTAVVAVAMAVMAAGPWSVAAPGSPPPADTGAPTSDATTGDPPTAAREVPVFAYFYQWFDAGSWDRAKIDLPAVGRYSSDDPDVLRGQVRSAQGAGIDGFIVSWKSTATNNRRLRLLMTIAAEEHFKLAMIYQGLDFERQPQPVQRVAADFVLFRDTYAPDPVFYRVDGKPLTILSGSWMFDHAAVESITDPVRDALLVLSTEKNLNGYRRLADVTDGDAYYWSSVNPETNSSYADKLTAMGSAVRADGKLWIAPFSPGFDARLVGGTGVVDRKDGETLTTQYKTALSSFPDILGLISWNEFSENTYVEPSENFGDRYLTALRQLIATESPTAPPPGETDLGDSSSSAGTDGDLATNIGLLGLFAVGFVTVVALLTRRARRLDRAGRADVSDLDGSPTATPLHDLSPGERRS
jgi:hypothetical protein